MYESWYPIKGNTFPVRAQLRRLGGQWDKARRAWVFEHVPGSREAQTLVDLVAADPMLPQQFSGKQARQGALGKIRTAVQQFPGLAHAARVADAIGNPSRELDTPGPNPNPKVYTWLVCVKCQRVGWVIKTIQQCKACATAKGGALAGF